MSLKSNKIRLNNKQNNQIDSHGMKFISLNIYYQDFYQIIKSTFKRLTL